MQYSFMRIVKTQDCIIDYLFIKVNFLRILNKNYNFMKESDIRPKNLFEEYLLLSKNDAKNFDKTTFIKVRCVACGSKNVKDHIKKDGFIYQICVECNSLFCSPRPDVDTLNKFYQNSKSSKFWSEIFLPSVERDRKEKCFIQKL